MAIVLILPRFLFKPSYNIKVCDKMSSQELKIMCYAMFLKDYKYCSLVGPSYSFCVDFVSSALDLNESFCKNLDGYKKTSCTVSLAIKSKSPNTCDLLGNSTASSCYYLLSSYLDYLNVDENFCDKISEESLKFICLVKLNKNIQLCENIKQELFEKGNCFALASKNISYCSTTSNYDYCLLLVALETKDFDLCKKIDTKGNKISCLLRIKNDISYCDEFEDTWKDYCTLNLLQLKNLNII
jgi:hypothetical protein